ncbi:hypothetical protein [Amycolatopsis sp. CA-230715]|uniref:hypothetical protein n=1 Tax=Amycolatopsis sp. CA-230715 TaxID=2745196 RepID=UPI001C028806|nr:hypothetical protein [Amycolatopsis sp. CA-230715]QWF81160.1 hypothetical protein HUW46_04586 [Amycolatopsis sp. CA-230715]
MHDQNPRERRRTLADLAAETPVWPLGELARHRADDRRTSRWEFHGLALLDIVRVVPGVVVDEQVVGELVCTVRALKKDYDDTRARLSTIGGAPFPEFWLPARQMAHLPCQWFAGCRTLATAIRQHPVLGPVPVCGAHTVENFGYGERGR